MPQIKRHIIHPFKTINLTSVNTTGYVEVFGSANFVKTKKRHNKMTLNSIFKNAFLAYLVLIKLFFAKAEILTLCDCKFCSKFSDYFNNSHLTCFIYNNTITEIYANIYKLLIVCGIKSNNILYLYRRAFLNVEEKQKMNLQLLKHFKNEKNYQNISCYGG